jgi:uncharacterized protein DUF2330
MLDRHEIERVFQSLRIPPSRLVDAMLDNRLVKIALRETVERVWHESDFAQPGAESLDFSLAQQSLRRSRRKPEPDAHRMRGRHAGLHRERITLEIRLGRFEIGTRMDVSAVTNLRKIDHAAPAAPNATSFPSAMEHSNCTFAKQGASGNNKYSQGSEVRINQETKESIMRRALPVLLLLSLAALVCSWQAGDARGCAVAPPLNKVVEIADESAIIIWDRWSSTEHFIRRATFRSAAQDFGFLVPTPTKPDLSEASDEAFSKLARVTAPRIVKQPQPAAPGCSLGCSESKSPGRALDSKPVRVIEAARVAGYDAVILEADDANALAWWLKDHGYDFSDSVREWAEYYIKEKWKLTAFKVSKEAKEAADVSTSAVRMTFKTDQPIYPYREPKANAKSSDMPPSRRLLRVYFLGTERVEGLLEGTPWPGIAAWSGPVQQVDRDKIAEDLKMPSASLPANCWLTEFEDFSSPRPGTSDVFFQRSEDQSKIERIHVEYTSSNLPGCVMCLAACAFIVGMRVVRRR